MYEVFSDLHVHIGRSESGKPIKITAAKSLNFANIVNNAPVDGMDITIGSNEKKNVFRKDEVKKFEDNEALLANAPEEEQHMFKVPKVIE